MENIKQLKSKFILNTPEKLMEAVERGYFEDRFNWFKDYITLIEFIIKHKKEIQERLSFYKTKEEENGFYEAIACLWANALDIEIEAYNEKIKGIWFSEPFSTCFIRIYLYGFTDGFFKGIGMNINIHDLLSTREDTGTLEEKLEKAKVAFKQEKNLQKYIENLDEEVQGDVEK